MTFDDFTPSLETAFLGDFSTVSDSPRESAELHSLIKKFNLQFTNCITAIANNNIVPSLKRISSILDDMRKDCSQSPLSFTIGAEKFLNQLLDQVQHAFKKQSFEVAIQILIFLDELTQSHNHGDSLRQIRLASLLFIAHYFRCIFDDHSAFQVLEQALQLANTFGSFYTKGVVYLNLGSFLCNLNDKPEALKFLRQSVLSFEKSNQQISQSVIERRLTRASPEYISSHLNLSLALHYLGVSVIEESTSEATETAFLAHFNAYANARDHLTSTHTLTQKLKQFLQIFSAEMEWSFKNIEGLFDDPNAYLPIIRKLKNVENPYFEAFAQQIAINAEKSQPKKKQRVYSKSNFQSRRSSTSSRIQEINTFSSQVPINQQVREVNNLANVASNKNSQNKLPLMKKFMLSVYDPPMTPPSSPVGSTSVISKQKIHLKTQFTQSTSKIIVKYQKQGSQPNLELSINSITNGTNSSLTHWTLESHRQSELTTNTQTRRSVEGQLLSVRRPSTSQTAQLQVITSTISTPSPAVNKHPLAHGSFSARTVSSSVQSHQSTSTMSTRDQSIMNSNKQFLKFLHGFEDKSFQRGYLTQHSASQRIPKTNFLQKTRMKHKQLQNSSIKDSSGIRSYKASQKISTGIQKGNQISEQNKLNASSNKSQMSNCQMKNIIS